MRTWLAAALLIASNTASGDNATTVGEQVQRSCLDSVVSPAGDGAPHDGGACYLYEYRAGDAAVCRITCALRVEGGNREVCVERLASAARLAKAEAAVNRGRRAKGR